MESVFKNGNFILFHFCIIDNLVYMLTTFSPLADSYDRGIVEKEQRPIGSSLALHELPR